MIVADPSRRCRPASAPIHPSHRPAPTYRQRFNDDAVVRTDESRQWNQYVIDQKVYSLPSKACVATGDTSGNILSKCYVNKLQGPRLLRMLRGYEDDELRRLQVKDQPSGDPRRLNVYRFMFDAIINEFSTYKSILSDIKKEYECSLLILRGLADQIYPLQDELAEARLEAECRIVRATTDLRAQLSNINKNNESKDLSIKTLQEKVNEFQEQNAVLRKENLTMKSSNYMDDGEGSSRLRADFEEKLRALDTLSNEKDEEITALKSELVSATQKILELEIGKQKFENVVTRAEFDVANEENVMLRKQVDEVNAKYDSLDFDYQFANANLRSLQTEKNALEKRMATERFPDWDYIETKFQDEDIVAYEQLAKGLDSMDTIAVILHDLIKLKKQANIFSPSEETSQELFAEDSFEKQYYMGLGIGNEIPKYLRCKTRIPNRRLTKRNTGSLIRDVWIAKALYNADPKNLGRSMTLSEFFYQYLKKRFGAQNIIVQWGYNIHEACRRYRTTSVECKLFFDIITGLLDEEMYHHLQSNMEKLKQHVSTLDVGINGGKAKGTLLKSALLESLRGYWGRNNVITDESLGNALNADQPGVAITYKWIFQNAESSAFLDTVRSGEMALMEKLIDRYEGILVDSYKEHSKLTAAQFMKALSRLDVRKKKSDINQCIANGFGISHFDQLKANQTMEVSKFVSV